MCVGICGPNNPNCDDENPSCDYYNKVSDEELMDKAWLDYKEPL